MKKKVYLMLLLSLIPTVALFAEGDGGSGFGILSLLPPLLAIALAFITKQVILSLFLGVFSGALMVNGWNPIIAFLRTLDSYLVGGLGDGGWREAIIIFTLAIGGMIGIVNKMGGTKAIANALAKKAKTAKSAQIVTAIMGVVVFFDDYANTLIVGPTMRPLMDKMKVSREKLAYIVDSTAAPVVGLALISTWVGMELGLFGEAFAALGVDVNAYDIFIRTIPYTFYNIFALALVFMVAVRGRDFGPMLKAEKRARLTGQLHREGANLMAGEITEGVEREDETKLRAVNAIVPISTLLVVSFIGMWYSGYGYSDEGTVWYSFAGLQTCFGNADPSVGLLYGSITAAIVAGIMAMSQKLMKLGEVFDAFVGGAKSLVITAIILILAWALGDIAGEVGTADYLVGAVSDKVPGGIIPIIVFIISMLVAFATGTSWGTMAIVIPLAVPLAAAYVDGNPANAPLVIAALSAVLSGSIFGDHCSPISDTTIMSSMASGSDHLDHVKTQVPYALTGAGIAFICYLMTGLLHIPVVIALVVGLALVWAVVQFFGKKPEEA